MQQTTATREDDIAALVRAIHEDRVTAKDKERKESWTKYVSLMIVVLAVGATIASLKAGGFSSKVLLNQAKASDTWAYYQSKSIKRHISELEVHAGGAADAAAEVRRYQQEEAAVKADAERLELARDEAAKHGPPLGAAIACLQIAIALASVCLITKRRPLWAASAALGAVGLVYLVIGLFLV